MYHLNPILVLFQDLLMSMRHGELSHYFPDILSDASPTRGKKDGASFLIPWSHGGRFLNWF